MKKERVITRRQTLKDMVQARDGFRQILKNYPKRSSGREVIESQIAECDRQLATT